MISIVLVLNRSRGRLYLVGLIVFGSYLGLVLNLMFFPIPVPETWPANLSRSGVSEALESINWIPFNYHIGGGLKADIRSGFVDVVLNVLLTVPLGMGLVYLFRPRWFLLPLAALAVGLVFEGVQLFFKVALGVYYHSVDMSDVVTNASGVMIGAIVFMIINLLLKKLIAVHLII
ncbi:MAG: VanZ family protein [Anaerolineaceae bacterium]